MNHQALPRTVCFPYATVNVFAFCLVFSHVIFMNQSQPCRGTHLANGWPSTVSSVRPVGAGSGKYTPDPSAPTAKAAGPRVCHMESTGANREPAPAEHRMRKKVCISCIQHLVLHAMHHMSNVCFCHTVMFMPCWLMNVVQHQVLYAMHVEGFVPCNDHHTMQTYKYNAAPSASCHTCGKLSSKQ